MWIKGLFDKKWLTGLFDRVFPARSWEMPLESTLPAKLKLDAQLWKVLESATGLSIHRTNSNTPWNCVLPIPVMERSTQTFQEWVVAGQAAGKALTSDP